MLRISVETILLIVIAIAVVLVLSTFNFSSAFSATGQLRTVYFLVALCFWFLFTLSKFLPWRAVLKDLDIKIPPRKNILMLYSFFGLGFLPGVGQIGVLRYLDRFKKNGRLLSLELMLSLNFSGGLAGIALAIAASVFVSLYAIYLIPLFIVSYLSLFLLGKDTVYRRLNKGVKRYLRPDKFHFINSLMRYLYSLRKNRRLLSWKRVSVGMFLFLPSVLLEATMFFFIVLALNQSLSFISVLLVFTVSITLGAFSSLPGGIGPTEASMFGLLVLFGVGSAAALSIIVVFRLLDTLLVLLVGYAALLTLKATTTKNISSRS